MKKNKKFFTVYQIKNLVDGRIYVGAHATNNLNDNYWGSSKYLREDIKKIGKENFEKRILYVFDNVEDMKKKEAEIVNREWCHSVDTYNRIEGGKNNFLAINRLAVKDKEGNIFGVYKDDPRYLSGELISITEGTISVKDKNGNTFRIKNTDERYLSGELISTNKNRKLSNKTKQKISKSRKGKYKKENNPFYGKTHTEEVKEKIRESRYNYFRSKKENNETFKGHKISEETKKKISDSLKKIKRFKTKCPYCNKEGDSRNMKRYHFDNCKLK